MLLRLALTRWLQPCRARCAEGGGTRARTRRAEAAAHRRAEVGDLGRHVGGEEDVFGVDVPGGAGRGALNFG